MTMKHRFKNFIIGACTFVLLGNAYFAAADTASDTETLLNWAENSFPQYFAPHQTTKASIPGCSGITLKQAFMPV